MKYLALLPFCGMVWMGATQAYNPEHLAAFKNTKECYGCDFNQLNLSPAILGSNDISGVMLTGTYVYGSSIEHLNLENIQARELIGLGLMLHDNDLSNADFSYGDLPDLKVTMWNRGRYVRFIGANLDGANFSYTRLDAPVFREASLSGAILYQIRWPDANLADARLRGADLTYAMLRGATLENANLTDALLNHADFTNANLLNAQVTSEQLSKALSVCNAIMPDASLGECKNL